MNSFKSARTQKTLIIQIFLEGTAQELTAASRERGQTLAKGLAVRVN